MEVKEVIPVKPLEPGKKRAMLLLSGGLDSMLAGVILEKQGIDVLPVSFKSSFFGTCKAHAIAWRMDWPLIEVEIYEEQIQIVENPKYGYGKNLNPCIDCHAQMIRIAGNLMDKYGASFIATGEVLWERPKSQNKEALEIVEKESGFEGLVLRPLSAKLLKKTIPEIEGWVDRSKLYDISGRSRKRQMELAEKFGIKEYPTPGGGCLLTDPGFSARLRKLMKWRGRLVVDDIELIKYGRHFFENGDWIVIGRDKYENKNLEALATEGDFLIVPISRKGPTTVVRSKNEQPSQESLLKAELLTIRYSQARNDYQAIVSIRRVGSSIVEERVHRFEEWQPYLVQSVIPPF